MQRVLTFDGTRATEVARALGSDVRASILDMVGGKPMTISQIASELGIAQPAVTNHVRILEQAGLLSIDTGTGERGTTKLCSRSYDEVRLCFSSVLTDNKSKQTIQSIPVGHFSRCDINPTCGMASESALIGQNDDPRSFYLPERTEAGMIWFGWGYVEYDFPNPVLAGQSVERVELSMEICSEAPGWSENYPSDITFSINDRELGIWTCPGDMGAVAGILNPDWWVQKGFTQYGFLKTVSVRSDGTFIDGVRVSSLTPDDILDMRSHNISVRLEVKESAVHKGGLTIFGHQFGNYPQDVELRIVTV